MTTVAAATGKFADRIVEMLEIFDLSFFVSGAAALGAIYSAAGMHGAPLPALRHVLDGGEADSGVGLLFIGIVASYVVGLGCFATGRVLRGRLFVETRATQIREAIREHRLADVLDLADYLPVEAKGERARQDAKLVGLYNRLWVHVRTIPELAASFTLVKRYWILAATFDGLGIALLAWLWPLLGGVWLAPGAGPGLGPAVVLAAVLVVSAFLSWRQAAEYRRYQVDELVATAVHWHALRQDARRAPTAASLAPQGP